MKRTKKHSLTPVTSNRAGIRRVSRSTVVATSATIAADKRLAALLGEDEPASPPGGRKTRAAAPEASSPDRDKLGRRRGLGALRLFGSFLHTIRWNCVPPTHPASDSRNSGLRSRFRFRSVCQPLSSAAAVSRPGT